MGTIIKFAKIMKFPYLSCCSLVSFLYMVGPFEAIWRRCSYAYFNLTVSVLFFFSASVSSVIVLTYIVGGSSKYGLQLV